MQGLYITTRKKRVKTEMPSSKTHWQLTFNANSNYVTEYYSTQEDALADCFYYKDHGVFCYVKPPIYL